MQITSVLMYDSFNFARNLLDNAPLLIMKQGIQCLNKSETGENWPSYKPNFASSLLCCKPKHRLGKLPQLQVLCQNPKQATDFQ